MADHYARTVAVAGATTVTLDGMPWGAGRMVVSKVGGDGGDCWISVGNTPAASGGVDSVVIPAGDMSRMVWINGLLQRTNHVASWPDFQFTVDYAGPQLHVEVIDVCGITPGSVYVPPVTFLMYDPVALMYVPDPMYA